MVAKINRGASLYGAIAYNQQKVGDSHARIISGNRMVADITDSPERLMQRTMWAFESYLLANRNTEKPILHISLNPSPEDKLTDAQFANLAKEYMDKMGYGDQPYHCIYARGHRPSAYPHRFHLRERERRKDR